MCGALLYLGMGVVVVVVTIVVMVLCASDKSTKIVVVTVRCGVFVDDGDRCSRYDCGHGHSVSGKAL